MSAVNVKLLRRPIPKKVSNSLIPSEKGSKELEYPLTTGPEKWSNKMSQMSFYNRPEISKAINEQSKDDVNTSMN